MLLHPKARHYTAFTVPGKGQFQWVTSPMGLLGCPSSFQRLMETVVHGINDVIVYIDDLLLHSATHIEHLALVDQVLQRLITHGIKLNLAKCVFGSPEVAYLGFHLTPNGITPGKDKLKAVREALPPSNVHEVRQFLGLCNFFRTHVRNFAQVSSALTQLTKKECDWKGGELPPAALQAFKELQTILCSEPVVGFPRRDRPYALITDASLGDDAKPGGLGAILTQIQPDGEHQVIAYASRKLQKHEKNYTPYLIEMQAAIWGMEHFETYLRGRPFTLITDHKPLEKLGKVHTKTLNRLQEAMNTFNFDILYRKGSEMPADFLSRNLVSSISWNNDEIKRAQEQDEWIRAVKAFLLNQTLPKDANCQQILRQLGPECFVEDDLVWRRVKRSFEPSRVVLLLPKSLVPQVLEDAHGGLLSGHDGIFKTKERLFQCYYWPGMDKDIGAHLSACHRCQVRRTDHPAPPPLLSPLPQCSEPNQRIHADLFGPLKTSERGKKFILSITDAFTKLVELVALENKESSTVAEALFNRWFCRYGVPLEIVTDQGGEFKGRLTQDLFKLMRTNHQTTSSRHPQCNSQAEVANKTIAKYLSSFVDDTTLDWEIYLAPLMFSYNTSFHRSIKTSPHFLTYGIEALQPGFPTADIRRKFYGESSSDELMQRLLYARDVARQNNQLATDRAEADHNRKAQPHQFKEQQLVLLDEHSFLHKNAKLAPKWSGPHRIIRLKNDNNVELRLRHNDKKLLVHCARLKPYIVHTNASATFPELPPTPSTNVTPNSTPEHSAETWEYTEPETTWDFARFQDDFPELRPTTPTPPTPAAIETPAEPARRRGRPPKIRTESSQPSAPPEIKVEEMPLQTP
ncbi:MAG: RNase H-like domain-containing protein, partial [Armatimonadota bacterium]